ncbi:glycosyltransferase family 2 protein [Symbiopectobacterium sp. Eva_TO]
MKYLLVVPTYNGGAIWGKCADKIKQYCDNNVSIHVIDSSSTDNTREIAKNNGFHVTMIDSKDFNHGGTRNIAVENNYENFDIVIFLTQDAIPEANFVERIIEVFTDDTVACAYGRQLPHLDAKAIAEHARYFNYSHEHHVYSIADVPQVGIKAVFLSNSFSAYRVSVFRALNFFPTNCILGEDMHFAARAVLAGYKIAYVADAQVRHSHNYSVIEEFKRYFDIGVFHADEPWIREKFGGAGGEGIKYIRSEFKYLLKKSPISIPIALLNNFMKLFGYKLGQKYRHIPKVVIKQLSMHKRYWR